MKKYYFFLLTMVSLLHASETIADKRAKLARERAQVLADSQAHRQFIENQQQALDALVHVGQQNLDAQRIRTQAMDQLARDSANGIQLELQNLDRVAVEMVQQSGERKVIGEELQIRLRAAEQAFANLQQLINSLPQHAQRVQDAF